MPKHRPANRGAGDPWQGAFALELVALLRYVDAHQSTAAEVLAAFEISLAKYKRLLRALRHLGVEVTVRYPRGTPGAAPYYQVTDHGIFDAVRLRALDLSTPPHRTPSADTPTATAPSSAPWQPDLICRDRNGGQGWTQG